MKTESAPTADSTTKHTPGPWNVGFRAMFVSADDPYGKGFMKICDVRGWGHLTGGGHGAVGMETDDAIAVQTANAHLIAAAPDLYAALSELLACYTDGTDACTCIRTPYGEKVQPFCEVCNSRTALAKARGEAGTQ